MKNGVSTGNWLTIVVLLVSVAVAWGSWTTSLRQIQKEVEKKADKDVVELKLDYIIEQINELKGK